MTNYLSWIKRDIQSEQSDFLVYTNDFTYLETTQEKERSIWLGNQIRTNVSNQSNRNYK